MASPVDMPGWATTAEAGAAARLDVRPILAAGGEPFAAIMEAAARVFEGGVLVLDAPFDPAPLRRVLADKGFDEHVIRLGAQHWRLYFRRRPTGTASDEVATDVDGARFWQEGGAVHIDVRGLAPPLPLRSIVRLIDSTPAPDAVIVHHEREPLFLYAELAERGWRHEPIPGAADEIRLRLTRLGAR